MERLQSHFQQLKGLTLTDRERDERKKAILEHMLAHPREYPRLRILHAHRMLFASAGAIILFIAGALFVGEHAIPGDLAYIVKVEVTEHVIDAVTMTDEGRMDWEITKAERRQQEAEQLAAQGGI